MKIGNLVRPLRQPADNNDDPIDLDTLGVVIEVKGPVIKVRWPDKRILTFMISDLQNLE